MNLDNRTELAETLGRKAFHGRMVCTPTADQRLMELVEGAVGNNIEILTAWQYGWMSENLKTEI